MASIVGGAVSYIKQGRQSAASLPSPNAADQIEEEPGTLEYYLKKEGIFFKRVIVFGKSEEVLHALNADNVAAKDCRSAVAVVTSPVRQDALVQPFRFMGKSYMVQAYYPDQMMAYGRANGSHPADSEGFCILGGQDIYTISLFQYPLTTARAIPALNRIFRALGYHLAAFPNHENSTEDAKEKDAKEQLGRSTSRQDETLRVDVKEPDEPQEKRGIFL